MCHRANPLRKFLYNFILHFCKSVIIRQGGIHCVNIIKYTSHVYLTTKLCQKSPRLHANFFFKKKNDIETYYWPCYITWPNPHTPEKNKSRWRFTYWCFPLSSSSDLFLSPSYSVPNPQPFKLTAVAVPLHQSSLLGQICRS